MKTSFNLFPQGNTPHRNAVPLTAKRYSSRRAFTLIELLVVIAIIAILSRSKNSFFLLFSAI